MRFFKNRKGLSLDDLQNVVMTFVIIGLLAGIGMIITTNMEASVAPTRGNQTNNGTEATLALNNSTRALGNLVARLPLIGTIAGFIVLLGFVLTILVRRSQGQ